MRTVVKHHFIVCVLYHLLLQQLIDAFGICVCSTVRSRFPRGPKVPGGTQTARSVKNLKTDSFVNSIIELSENNTSNQDVLRFLSLPTAILECLNSSYIINEI